MEAPGNRANLEIKTPPFWGRFDYQQTTHSLSPFIKLLFDYKHASILETKKSMQLVPAHMAQNIKQNKQW